MISPANSQMGALCRRNTKGLMCGISRWPGPWSHRQPRPSKAFVHLTLKLTFEDGLIVNAPELSDLREALELVSLGNTIVTAERYGGSS